MNEQPKPAATDGAKDTDATTTVGALVAAFLEACGVETAFGVISIHNMPILDALAQRGRIRFVPARGEAGALNMADACARVTGRLGVGLTSTGVAAGNAAGSLVEALTAGTPLLHLTGQVETEFLDQGRGYIHEAPDQPGMLRAISKKFFRVSRPEDALDVLREAVTAALTPPAGPVSVEIPIDVQAATIALPDTITMPDVPVPAPDPDALDALAEMLRRARRPLFWLGGGARGAAAEARTLAEMGIGIVTSVNGRGVVPEDHPMSLGAFNAVRPVAEFYQSADLMVAVGSRLRGNETLKNTLALPQPMVRIDADPAKDGMSYTNELFVEGDATLALQGLIARLGNGPAVDPGFAGDLAAAKAAAVKDLRDGFGPYARIVDDLRAAMPDEAPWVRDITVSNSTWGNRYVDLGSPRQGVHALGGGIGQGLAMAIGAALGAGGRKTVALVGDGGLALGLGELATAVQEKADIALVLMNDLGYGVIRNIQDAQYGGRRAYADLVTPDFGALATAIGLAHERVDKPEGFADAFARALAVEGPAIVEIDMNAVGPYAKRFAGPPVA
ncbi:MAG: thiamine pyrophosphate-binding protein [Alphaproteobacteria bacterium]|nr:thiamine pyrophosphate-binding protein [Alphaproteobacteria bacterium]